MTIRMIMTSAMMAVAMANLATAAVVTNPAPGSLHTLVSDPGSETELTVTGPIDAADLFFIASCMPSLQKLDLTNATIEAYEGDAICGAANHRKGAIPGGVFAGSKIHDVAFPANGTVEINDLAFASSQIETLTLATNVATVGMGAFCACPRLTKVEIIGNCSLGSHVFSDCTSLTEARLVGLDSIAASTFAGCTSLRNIHDCNRLKTIGRRAFAGCTALESFDFSTGIQAIGDEAFTMSGLTDIDLSSCNGLGRIGDWAFAGCDALTDAKLPRSLPDIGRGLFFDCKSLTSLTLPSESGTIGDFAMKGLESVGELTIPGSTRYIGDFAMGGMTGLTMIDATSPDAVPALGREVWDAVAQQDVKLKTSDNLAEAFSSTPQWQEFEIITAESGVDSPIADTVRPSITCRFDGYLLKIRSTGAGITDVRIYDTAGRLLMRGNASPAQAVEEVTIDASGLTGNMFIIDATLADGTRGALKIIR